jgi:D-arabinose 1-dehydrogenase-like Zn-dependent alcohol dehydrogenase
MHAVRLARTPGNLADETLADPHPAAQEVVIDIRAAGICHSDGHYRAGRGSVALPLTLGHEIAGVVIEKGSGVADLAIGDRVAVHYLLSCGACDACRTYGEQFCASGAMIGKDRDGGYAERIVVPARNAVPIPDAVPFEHAAVMMCSTATAWHALRLAGIRPGESLSILGFGGLGVSALQLARVLGVETIHAVDVVPAKLEAARRMGALTADAMPGADVVLDFAGHAATTSAALRALAPGGRLMVVAINLRELPLDPYRDVLARERRIIGCSDHLREELVELLDMAARRELDLSAAITRTVPLDANTIDAVLDDVDRGTSHLRSVIVR